MKIRLFLKALSFVVLAASLWAGPRAAEWDQVDAAVRKGLPKTAIEHLDTIVAGALAEKNYAEAIKAIGLKVAFEGQIQGNKPEERILRMQAELERAPAEMKPVMEAILAHWYWQYFQQNRWQFMQRTATEAPPGPDFQTWDLRRILAEIDRHYTAALADPAVLQATPVRAYDDLLVKGSVPDSYRPTMFDFLAHEALQFYEAGEQGGVQAEDDFEVAADGPIFAEPAAFLGWRKPASEEPSPHRKAIGLFQALLTFHQADSDPAAFLEADLERLTFGRNVAVGDDKDERYEAALRHFIEVSASHEITARALALLATQRNAGGAPAEARELARRGLEAFPKSPGGAMCFNLIHEIEARSAQLETERVWNAPWPTLDVTYRNVTKVYFRAVPADFVREVTSTRWNYENFGEIQRRAILAATPALAWEADLPATTDFKARTERLPAPTSLKPGYYFIVASHDPSFGNTDNQVSLAAVWVSNLALILRMHYDSAEHGGLVLRADSGEPVAGATVRLWQRDNQGWLEPLTPATTDKDGRFGFTAKNHAVVVLAEAGDQAVASTHELYSYGGGSPDQPGSETVFFIDRAIYRPGQAINYKGVSIRYDREAGKYSAMAGLDLTVVFNDPNGKEIARAAHRTNDYGSFAGVFTAPRDRLAGRMTIQVLGRPSMAAFNVEEYKRPKFQVELDAPAEAAKLGATVEVGGHATAYTGAALGGAKVAWRVERGVRLPAWCWWWRPPEAKAIAHGVATSEPDGSFKIQFPAVPDRAVPERNEPTFVYTVHADVTDATGETRSAARAVRAGYAALQATLSADDWQVAGKPVAIAISTASLDGDPQPAKGTVTLYALKQPPTVARSPLQTAPPWWRGASAGEPESDPTNPASWAVAETVATRDFTSDQAGKASIAVPLAVGIYRASLETVDRFGRKVTARATIEVVDPHASRLGLKLADHLGAPRWSVEPGETFTALWGTGYDQGRALVEVECNGRSLARYWTAPGRTQVPIEQAVTGEMRGGFTLRVSFVRDNRAYLSERIIDVPWSDKQLAIKWETFRSKLTPGQKETWTAVVTGPDARRSAAEMVATLYDASLDQFLPHNWPEIFNVFRHEHGRGNAEFQNGQLGFRAVSSWLSPRYQQVNWRFRSFPNQIIGGFFSRFLGGALESRGGVTEDANQTVLLSPFDVSAEGLSYNTLDTLAGARLRTELKDMPSAISVVTPEFLAGAGAPKPDLTKVSARKNLSETAFFFPQLLSDNGVVRMRFTVPEALTEWKFLGFAHDAQLRAGLLTGRAVTSKDLMVEPNPPRFLREGDAIEFTVKVSNQTEQAQSGTVKLTFADAASLKPADEALGNRAAEQPFAVPARQSRTYSWRIAVPDGLGFLTYKAVAAGAQFSDGEEGFLPVLSRRVLVTESLPLPIRGPGTREFAFKKLLESGRSDTLRNESLTVQMVSQPAWYAVMALPYLMEYPYECSEQVFNRLYANELARHLANGDPKIRRIFDLWRNTPALDSPLEKNQDLKSVMLEETPWLRQAKAESQARRNVGLLFDANRLDEESARALRTLADRQLGDGLWPWFPGGRGSEYISLYIMTGFGRLRHLGVEVEMQAAVKSLAALDAWMDDSYRRIQDRPHPEAYVPSSTDALYLYGRSFFLGDQPVAAAQRTAVDFFLRQSRKFWLETNCRQSQAQLALALQRFGDSDTPAAIMKSLKERSVSDPELGMFWRDGGESWWWYRAPIETQALMIEAFAEVSHDATAVEDCKVWLLKQKQTQDWRTTKATADAVYALLLRGENLLGSDALVEVALGGETIQPGKVEAGTGFYEKKFVRDEIKPAMGQITVRKVDGGVSWGAVHWQYLEDIAKVTPHEGTPLKLTKALFVKETTARGPVLRPVTGPVSVGDELVVRVELRTDRDMEFVHLKDQRGSGTEPVDVLSRYRYQDGLGYYETTRDTATHFFIDYLPKGVYVFEYSTRVQLKGTYQTGFAEIQCMYAPEFNSHSQSIALEVK